MIQFSYIFISYLFCPKFPPENTLTSNPTNTLNTHINNSQTGISHVSPSITSNVNQFQNTRINNSQTSKSQVSPSITSTNNSLLTEHEIGSTLGDRVQNELFTLKDRFLEFDKLCNSRTPHSVPSINDNYRTLDTNDPPVIYEVY